MISETRARVATIATLLLSSAVLASGVDQPAGKPTDVPAVVIAHLNLPQPAGNQLLLQKKEDSKQYLYVQLASRQGFMIVDVTKPDQPSVLKRSAESDESTAGNLQMMTPDVAIAQSPEKTTNPPASSGRAAETVRLLDLSDPKNPKTLETFNKVTGLLTDGHHGLIYLTNDQGLWVLRYNRPALLEPAKKKPPCDSESEIMAMPPDCD